MQFCMHYAFESVTKVRCMLQNVTRWLRPGGVFVGTIPNAEQLLMRLDQIPAESSELSFGNSVYSIKFETRQPRPLYGHRYSFFLQDAVEDIPEYVVHWESFVQCVHFFFLLPYLSSHVFVFRLAAEYGLHPLYRKEFHEVFEEFQEYPEFKPLLQRMNVIDANGETEMDEDQWEAASMLSPPVLYGLC
jgi:mRNA (guanine-N7-)-methyltransferase